MYAYDDLYRLVSATATSSPANSQAWTYDGGGRIVTNSRVGTYTYSTFPFHAPATVGSNGFTYDPNGNLLAGGGRNLAWNTDNRLSQANGTHFVYDAAGERLKKIAGLTVSRYPFGDDYEITNGVSTKYFSVPGLGVVAKKVSGLGPSFSCTTPLDGYYWLHNDRQGSIQAITDMWGCQVMRRTYRPFGETISQAGTHVESRGWIDQRQDSETGLTYLHARYYDPSTGLFSAPDPLHPAAQGVGTNRYIYGLGDPANRTDRRGLMALVCIYYAERGWDCWYTNEYVEVESGYPDYRPPRGAPWIPDTSDSEPTKPRPQPAPGPPPPPGTTPPPPDQLPPTNPPGGPPAPPGNAAGQIIGAAEDIYVSYVNLNYSEDHPGQDQYYHCMATCNARRRGPVGGAFALCLMDARERMQEDLGQIHSRMGGTPAQCDADRAANRAGYDGDLHAPCPMVCAPFLR